MRGSRQVIGRLDGLSRLLPPNPPSHGWPNLLGLAGSAVGPGWGWVGTESGCWVRVGSCPGWGQVCGVESGPGRGESQEGKTRVGEVWVSACHLSGSNALQYRLILTLLMAMKE